MTYWLLTNYKPSKISILKLNKAIGINGNEDRKFINFYGYLLIMKTSGTN